MSIHRSCLVGFAITAVVLLASAVPTSAQVFSVVTNFGAAASNPYFVTPVQGRDGKLYGTTLTDNVNSAGTVFVLDVKTGSRFTLHRFDTATGSSPQGGLTLGTDGNFYGTAQFGGTANYGVLFKLTPNGTYSVLHNFAGGTDGLYPSSPPVQAADGNFYGTTGQITAFGESQSTAYQYKLSGLFTSFGDIPNTIAPLIQAANGNLYGTTYNGGCGSVFELSTSGALLNEYPFSCGTGGSTPFGPVMQAADGNFYGTTQRGGTSDYGTVFKMDQSGLLSILYSFPGSGPYPEDGLVEGSDGKLYGNAWGAPSTLFRITTGASFTLLYTLNSHDGDAVGAALLQDTTGVFYGTAYAGGGPGDGGTLFSLDVGLAPFIALVNRQGRVGSIAQILGQGFTGSTSVTFHGVAASSFHVLSDTYMTAVVPSGATSGPVAVTTPNSTLTSNRNFRVLQ